MNDDNNVISGNPQRFTTGKDGVISLGKIKKSVDLLSPAEQAETIAHKEALALARETPDD
jgi:hypothetical protein